MKRFAIFLAVLGCSKAAAPAADVQVVEAADSVVLPDDVTADAADATAVAADATEATATK